MRPAFLDRFKSEAGAWNWAGLVLFVLFCVVLVVLVLLVLPGCVIVRAGLPGGQHAESTNPACLIGCTAQASTAASAPASGVKP
jgi:hypothetical protein